jgi:hypothetical protein
VPLDLEVFPDDPDLAAFDPADRKFVALALASDSHPSILNAVDSDWWHFREALRRAGVEVMFLCSDQVTAWGQGSRRRRRS